MTTTETLQKAIRKARLNGFRLDAQMQNLSELMVEGCFDEHVFARALVFDPKFARAFWGDRTFDYEARTPEGEQVWFYDEAWRYHLQQLALVENPIGYIERHL